MTVKMAKTSKWGFSLFFLVHLYNIDYELSWFYTGSWWDAIGYYETSTNAFVEATLKDFLHPLIMILFM